MTSRRAFLQGSALALPIFLTRPARALAERAAPEEGATTYGLFTDDVDLGRLRRLFQTPRFEPLRTRLEAIDLDAERRFITDEIRYHDHLVDLMRAYVLAEDLSFYYLMTEREDAATLAADVVRAIMKFPTWDYFLEGGNRVFGLQRAPGSTLGITLASDWLGEFITDEERRSWLRTMAERGLEPSYLALFGMRHPDRVEGWTMDETSGYFEHRPGQIFDLSNWPLILDRTNLKAIPASALAIGTVAYVNEFGEDADTERWLEQAVYSLGTFQDLYARDGSYDEGVSYANYTSLHLAQANEALSRHLGIDQYDLINWPGYVHYLREMTMPTEEDPATIVNFGDNSGAATAAVPYLVASRSFDGASQWFGNRMAGEYDAWSLLWYNPAIAEEAPPPGPHLWISDLDWLVARTGYEAYDLVVAMRSGPPFNHEHADRNSLIVKWHGEQLVVDPYRPPYSNTDPSWMMRGTAGHSALLIDGEGHQYHDGSEGTNASDAHARIIRFAEREDHLSWTSDATQAYQLVNDDVASVTRTVIVLHEVPAVIVLDKVIKFATPSRLQARYYAYNRDGNGRIDGAEDRFRTFRPRAALLGRALASEGASVRADHPPIPEEVALQHPFAEVATQEASLAPFLVTVLVAAPGDGSSAVAEIARADDGAYEIRCSSEGRTEHCRVFDTEEVPEYQVGAQSGS